jgi:O-methyltransferase involved in polyketide biosynthesis
MPNKIKIELKNVQETLFLPLWGRACETRKKEPLLVDTAALKIINKINYDFSTISKNLSEISQLGWVARSLLLDGIIKQFLKKHPDATVVNIGCGFDTTFERIDDGRIRWYDLDLPDVIALRKQFIKETNRRKFIASSFLDFDWFKKMEIKDSILFIAAGVFYYFEESQIKKFIVKTADLFPGCEIAFDATSSVKMANKLVVKRVGLDEKSFLKWALRRAKVIESWDKRIFLLGEYPMFKSIRNKLNFTNKIITLLSDHLKMQFMVHLKIKTV